MIKKNRPYSHTLYLDKFAKPKIPFEFIGEIINNNKSRKEKKVSNRKWLTV